MEQLTIGECRRLRGYSQVEVANAVGVHHQTLAKYERDSSDIPMSLANKLSELYGVKKDNIFFGKEVRK